MRHFVADNPPPDAVHAIEAVLHDTSGDLGAAAAALVRLDAAWQQDTKLRTPVEFVIASIRALDVEPAQVPNLVGVLGGLGQPLWSAPAPNGWPDCAADWAAPEAMLRRIDWASGLAGLVGTRDVADIASNVLGPLLRPETNDAIRRAGSRRDAMTLLLTSAEFQRR